jgi:hypothetical protein
MLQRSSRIVSKVSIVPLYLCFSCDCFHFQLVYNHLPTRSSRIILTRLLLRHNFFALLVTDLKKAVLTKSKAGTLCAFVHIDHADPTNTDDLVLTNSSRFADFKYTAALRSYEKSDWVLSPGPFEESTAIRVQKCNKRRCVLKFTAGDPYMSTGSFFLMTYSHQTTFEEELSRFFGQTTFGATNEMIKGWNYDQDLKGMATWIKNQVELPTTSLRETFRKNADFSLWEKSSTNRGAIMPRHPCNSYSRWRTYAFGGDEFNRQFEVQEVSGNRNLVLMNGSPRTYVTEWKSHVDGSSSETGTNFFLGKFIHFEI